MDEIVQPSSKDRQSLSSLSFGNGAPMTQRNLNNSPHTTMMMEHPSTDNLGSEKLPKDVQQIVVLSYARIQ